MARGIEQDILEKCGREDSGEGGIITKSAPAVMGGMLHGVRDGRECLLAAMQLGWRRTPWGEAGMGMGVKTKKLLL